MVVTQNHMINPLLKAVVHNLLPAPPSLDESTRVLSGAPPRSGLDLRAFWLPSC